MNILFESVPPPFRAAIAVIGIVGFPIVVALFFMLKDIGVFSDLKRHEHQTIVQHQLTTLRILNENQTLLLAHNRQTAALVSVLRVLCTHMAENKSERDECLTKEPF